MADEGIFDKASGKIKETAGKLTDDKNLELTTPRRRLRISPRMSKRELEL